MLLVVIAVLAMHPGDKAAVAQSTMSSHPRQPFPTNLPRPLRVGVGFYLIDFARVNGREESFDLQGYLTATWIAPALARGLGEATGERRFPTDALWTPDYEFNNALEQVKIQNEADLVVTDEGRITQRIRFIGKFS